MPESQIIYIVVGLAVVVLIVVMQLKTRPLRESSATRLTVILGVIGVVEIYNAAKGHPLGAWTVPWLAGSVIIGGALGAARAVTVRIWRTEDGTALVKGTAVTAVLWIVSVAAHFALQVGINHSTRIAGFGSASLLLYLAITLGAQRAVLRRRAASISTGHSLIKAQLSISPYSRTYSNRGAQPLACTTVDNAGHLPSSSRPGTRL